MSTPIGQPTYARPDGSPAPEPGSIRASTKATQRDRLVEAMIGLCAESGYTAVSVAQVSSRAGVSSATFYQQFEDKEDCLLAAYRAAVLRVFGEIPIELPNGDWSGSARMVLEMILSGLERDPNAGRVLFVEALAGGGRLRAARERVLEVFERAADQNLDGTTGASTVDIPVTALVGAVRSIVSRYLRVHAEDRLPTLVDDLLTWIASYEVPGGEGRWSTGPRALLDLPAPRKRPDLTRAAREAPRLPRGRHNLPPGVVSRSQHGRIVRGTAEVVMSKGYANTTVSDIVAAAGVSRDVFYEHFTNKQHAFLEAQQHATRHIVDSCAHAYFAGDGWPERVWNALQTLVGLIAANPAVTHLRVVEAYAAGPTAIRGAEEMPRAATIFLQEGFHYRPEAQRLPRLCSQAITGAIFEVIYGHLARGQADDLPRHLPQLTYIAIAPFTGPREAVELLEGMSASA